MVRGNDLMVDETVEPSFLCFTYDREGVHADDDDEYHDDVIEFER